MSNPKCDQTSIFRMSIREPMYLEVGTKFTEKSRHSLIINPKAVHKNTLYNTLN